VEEHRVRVRIAAMMAAVTLFAAGALGLLGPWALGAAVVLLVATSVVTAIAWEEGDRPEPEGASAAALAARLEDLVPARASR
jgi:hypothetical protein